MFGASSQHPATSRNIGRLENSGLRRYLSKLRGVSGQFETVFPPAGPLRVVRKYIPTFPKLFSFFLNPKKYRWSNGKILKKINHFPDRICVVVPPHPPARWPSGAYSPQGSTLPMLKRDRQHLRLELNQRADMELARLRAATLAERKAVREEYPFTNWKRFLVHQAAQDQALRVPGSTMQAEIAESLQQPERMGLKPREPHKAHDLMSPRPEQNVEVGSTVKFSR